MLIKAQGKKLEKASRALADIQSQQYQKDAHKCEDTQGNENVDKVEYAVLAMTEKKSSTRIEPIQYKIRRIQIYYKIVSKISRFGSFLQ